MPGPYLSPGVYVEEVPPAASPIAGVGTSTAGFIGIIPDTLYTPPQALTNQAIATGDGTKKEFDLKIYPVDVSSGKFQIRVNGAIVKASLANDDTGKKSKVTIDETAAPVSGAVITGDYIWTKPTFTVAPHGVERLCTNFGQFKEAFGDLLFTDKEDSSNPTLTNRYLAHAVYGFFNNGGTVCYVIRYKDRAALDAGLAAALNKFATIDEIALVAAPGITGENVQEAILDHCENLKDRFAVLDGQKDSTKFTKAEIQKDTRDSSYGAIYFPWIKVADPLSSEPLIVPPSGHITGVYARVDAERGVFKAPANELIRGALDVEKQLTQNDQQLLNPKGVNAIRVFNGNVKIWGARTMGGDDNGAFKYISTRRLMNFLRESIDEGTQFAVFEPNSPSLWQRIKRNVNDFLLGQWRDGALFGEIPKQAFFVKCDEQTNPADVRERGEVVTEIGVAIVKPAEFVIFRIQQMTGG